MGILSSLRNFHKKRPGLGMLLVVVLSLGLVGGVPLLASSRHFSPGGGNPEAVEPAFVQEEIAKLESQREDLTRKLESQKDHAPLYVQLGDVETYLGFLYSNYAKDWEKAQSSYREALASYQKAQALNPQDYGLYPRMINAALYVGEGEVALELFRKALDLNPGDNEMRLNYGYYLALRGDLQGAVQQWEEILKHNPSPEMAQTVQDMLAKIKDLQGGK
ncbi:MAG TPA: tetratricopeptide repeat protein [Moorella mulderi]|nr:tetratricopeptide repeat protein [Moorella mulderi]